MAGFVNYVPHAQPILPAQPADVGGGSFTGQLPHTMVPESASQNAIIASLGNLLPAGFGGPVTQGPGPATSPVASPGAPGAVAGSSWPVGTSRFGILNPPRGLTWQHGLAPGAGVDPRSVGVGPRPVQPAGVPFAQWIAQHLAAGQAAANGTGAGEHPLAGWLRQLFGAGVPPAAA